jgi:hypothetical protein
MSSPPLRAELLMGTEPIHQSGPPSGKATPPGMHAPSIPDLGLVPARKFRPRTITIGN